MIPIIRNAILSVCFPLIYNASASAQMFDSMTAKPVLYVMVSTSMPESVLNGIVLDASHSGGSVVLVLRGFPVTTGQRFDGSMGQASNWVSRVNNQCCSHQKGGTASWMVDPKLFDKYGVQNTPTFVLVHPALGSGDGSFTKVSGNDYSLGDALKTMAKVSQVPRLRQAAAQVYNRTFARD